MDRKRTKEYRCKMQDARCKMQGARFFLLLTSFFLLLTYCFLFLFPHYAIAEDTGIGAPAAVEDAKKSVSPTPVEKPKPVGLPAPKLKVTDYPRVGGMSSRVMIWVVAQLHLFFAALVLGVPIFVLVIEIIGVATGDERYDRMAHEFMKISLTAFSITAIVGGTLTFLFIILYPDFFKYMAGVFSSAMVAYAIFFFGESFFLYIYYYAWDAMRTPFQKWLHLTIGLLLNTCGMSLMVLSNAWATFMMAPTGVDDTGAFLGNIWAAIAGPLWNPVNLHRFIANIAYGGAVVGAYAAYRFLTAETQKDKAHYDWMGYTANLIAVSGLLPLPFAGYWLMREVYAYSQQMGITLMGGILAWIFIVQAFLIGSIFLGINYYLWLGMERIRGAERYLHFIKYMAIVLVGCFLVWFTPHTIIMTGKELKTLGSAHHPYLGFFGVMSAKNTAVNLMIVTTFLSFMLYKRGNKIPQVSWVKQGNIFVSALFAAAAANIISLGVYGYFLPANVRIGLSVPQVMTTLSVITIATIVDGFMYRRAKSVGPIEWGDMPRRSQYILILLAISFTWLMGLMGYVRSGVRQYWHVYTIMRDYSVDAFTINFGFAAKVISVTTIIFMGMVIFVFWLASFSKQDTRAPEHQSTRAQV
jgi:cytochrome bd-type quinol oxidase subunit 1